MIAAWRSAEILIAGPGQRRPHVARLRQRPYGPFDALQLGSEGGFVDGSSSSRMSTDSPAWRLKPARRAHARRARGSPFEFGVLGQLHGPVHLAKDHGDRHEGQPAEVAVPVRHALQRPARSARFPRHSGTPFRSDQLYGETVIRAAAPPTGRPGVLRGVLTRKAGLALPSAARARSARCGSAWREAGRHQGADGGLARSRRSRTRTRGRPVAAASGATIAASIRPVCTAPAGGRLFRVREHRLVAQRVA